MPSIRITKDQKLKLLATIRKGHDLEAAGIAMGLSEAQIEAAREKYSDEIDQAFRAGTALLRSYQVDFSIEKKDPFSLSKEIERREASRTGPVFTHIVHTVIDNGSDLTPAENERQQPAEITPEPAEASEKPTAPVEPPRRGYQGRIYDPGTRRWRDVDPLTLRFI